MTAGEATGEAMAGEATAIVEPPVSLHRSKESSPVEWGCVNASAVGGRFWALTSDLEDDDQISDTEDIHSQEDKYRESCFVEDCRTPPSETARSLSSVSSQIDRMLKKRQA